MAIKRKPFQGVLNIIRFNWHFYLLILIVCLGFTFSRNQFSPLVQKSLFMVTILGITITMISLIVSFYIYDLSDLYQLRWIDSVARTSKQILNIHAGFDETSEILRQKFPNAILTVCDFYDPAKHTEISIKRARRVYSLYPGTISVNTSRLPFPDNVFDTILIILSAHEIRNVNECIQFFKELNRILKSNGNILVTEHLRDRNNFLAYTIGSFHFYSQKSWLKKFKGAHLSVVKELKATPFITTFILQKNGDTL